MSRSMVILMYCCVLNGCHEEYELSTMYSKPDNIGGLARDSCEKERVYCDLSTLCCFYGATGRYLSSGRFVILYKLYVPSYGY